MNYKKILSRLTICLGALTILTTLAAQIKHPWDGSRTTPVHQIPLKDGYDQNIIPTESYPLPYSTRFTCGPCHDYEKIQNGLHFNAAASDRHGQKGEPWVLIEPKTGTVLPLSYRKWKEMWDPRELGLTPWEFTLLFGRHMPGGGVAEPKENESSPESRWNVSGRIEINCMGCHSASRMQSHSEWAKQILRQNFRWAATAASGLGEVWGMASRLPGTWDIFDGPNPDDTEWAIAPSVHYRPSRFDSKFRVFFDIAHKPDDQRCLTCHSVSPVLLKKSTMDRDVHSAVGLKCVDCHRNDISHDMIRGYEGEAEEYQDRHIADFSCIGCHTGKVSFKKAKTTGGRLGAPYPKHKGIPAVHFEKLSCTVCHSGPLPGKDFTRVRTSRANRLGIYGIAQWFTDSPHIIEPVFVKDRAGKITPNRLMWPAYWGRLEEEKVSPLKPADVQASADEILGVEEHIARILAALLMNPEIGGIPVLVTSGNIYEFNADGGLDVSPYSGEKPKTEILWAVKKNGEIASLVPDFEPGAEELDVEIEARIQQTLEALATFTDPPGKPVLIYKNVMYQILDGYLEVMEGPEKFVDTPQLRWIKDNKTQPLASEFQIRTVAATVGFEQSLTEEQIELVLKSLDQTEKQQKTKEKGKFFYISGGKMFLLDEKGELTAAEHSAADPVTWPLAHQVRPAQQSLGIKGCTECHKKRSAFFFNKVEGIGPLKTQKVAVRSAHLFMRLDKPFQKLFGISFSIRPVFKVVLFISALIIGSILILLLKNIRQKLLQKTFFLRYPVVEKWGTISLSVSFIFLAVSGFIYALFFTQNLHGYPLLFHVILGGIFAICLPLVVVLQAPVFSFWSKETEFANKIPGGRKRTGPVPLIQKIFFWLFVISGFLLILTALTSMLPAFSLKDQLSMADIHRYSALVALLSAIAFAYFTIVKDG